MPEYIPFELQIKILEELPIKSLIKFRSVSKPWKSIIDSSDFITAYNNSHTHPHQILLSFYDKSFVHIIDDDDDSFSPRKSFLELPLKMHYFYQMIGYSQGLFGFYYYTNSVDDAVIVIWNPSIRKSLDIPIPKVLRWPSCATVFGFGVCNATDPMIVKINYIDSDQFESISSIPSQVEVFKLSTRKWISLSDDTARLPRKSLYFSDKVVVTERFIYWLVNDRTHHVDGLNNLILSFDMICEKFTEISLPDSLSLANNDYLDLSKLRNSLVVLETNGYAYEQECGVWMMREYGGQNSFVKLYTLWKKVLGFRKNGQPVIEMYNGDDKPNSGHFNDIEISVIKYSDYMGAYLYKGTLLLLDH